MENFNRPPQGGGEILTNSLYHVDMEDTNP
jgi:hypothetical protein